MIEKSESVDARILKHDEKSYLNLFNILDLIYKIDNHFFFVFTKFLFAFVFVSTENQKTTQHICTSLFIYFYSHSFISPLS